MPYLTPPPTTPPTSRTKRGLFAKYRRPTYYEDVYGQRNEDEVFDRYPDRCESESEEDDELDMSPSTSRGRKRKRHVQDMGDGNRRDTPLFVSDDEQENGDDELEVQYKIAPRVNPKSSIRTTPKMTPKKFGMFGGGKYAKEAEKTTRVEEDGGSTTDDEQVAAEKGSKTKVKERVQRIKRPAGWKSFKQELADRAKARKEAEKAERAIAKAQKAAEKKSKKAAKDQVDATKKGKPAKKLYWDDVRLTEKDSKRLEKEKLTVFIDNDSVDSSEYERYDD